METGVFEGAARGRREWGLIGSWNLSRVCRFFLFLNKRSIVYFHFSRWRGELRVIQLVIFCGLNKGMTTKCLKWFKITTNLVIRGSSFFFNIKTDRFSLPNWTTPQLPYPSPPLMTSKSKELIPSVGTYFLVKKIVAKWI